MNEATYVEASTNPESNGASPKLEAASRLLETGLQTILNEENYRAYLQMQAKFHDYSWANTLLIMQQKPDATHVTGYRKWQELGRQVTKGSRAIKIYFPIFRQYEEVDQEGTVHTMKGLLSFGLGNVFDVSQTEGEALPKLTIERNDDSSEVAADVNRKLSRFLIEDGIRCESRKINPRVEGMYSGGTDPKGILIRRDEGIDPLNIQKTKTLAHEAAHYLADHGRYEDRLEAELVAESAAYITMHYFGLDTAKYSFLYLATWKAKPENLRARLPIIQRTASTIIRGIASVVDPLTEDVWTFATGAESKGEVDRSRESGEEIDR